MHQRFSRLPLRKLRNRFRSHLLLIQKHGGNLRHKQLPFPTLNSLSVTLRFPQRNPEKSSALPMALWVEVSAVMGTGWVESAASVQLINLRLRSRVIISWKLYKSVPSQPAGTSSRHPPASPIRYRGRWISSASPQPSHKTQPISIRLSYIAYHLRPPKLLGLTPNFPRR